MLTGFLIVMGICTAIAALLVVSAGIAVATAPEEDRNRC